MSMTVKSLINELSKIENHYLEVEVYVNDSISAKKEGLHELDKIHVSGLKVLLFTKDKKKKK